MAALAKALKHDLEALQRRETFLRFYLETMAELSEPGEPIEVPDEWKIALKTFLNMQPGFPCTTHYDGHPLVFVEEIRIGYAPTSSRCCHE